MNPRLRLEHNEAVLSQEVGGTRVLLEPDEGRYYSLDEISGRIWDLCDGTREVREVIAAVEEEYESEPGVIEHDVEAFLSELLAERLLVVA